MYVKHWEENESGFIVVFEQKISLFEEYLCKWKIVEDSNRESYIIDEMLMYHAGDMQWYDISHSYITEQRKKDILRDLLKMRIARNVHIERESVVSEDEQAL